MGIQPFWRAEVYTEEDVEGGCASRKLFAGIYASRASAEKAARRKCQRVKGYGFYVHTLDQKPVTFQSLSVSHMEN